jgi:arginyl-tRNA synthetase
VESKKRCLKQFKSRNTDFDESTIQSSSLAMGIGAVKYADLRNNIETNYTFSFDRMLDLKGNTAVYLQYTFARISSIVQRAENDEIMTSVSEFTKPVNSQERALMLHLLRFEDAVDSMLGDLMPSKLCEYLYTLCVLFNNFYSECKVFGADEESQRLMICALTLKVLNKCFGILGIRPLNRI